MAEERSKLLIRIFVPEDSTDRFGLLGCSVICKIEQVATAVN